MSTTANPPPPTTKALCKMGRIHKPKTSRKSTPRYQARNEISDSKTSLRDILPAPPRRWSSAPVSGEQRRTCFYDLPAELRIEIYRMVLEDVTVHIVPLTATDRHSPHALLRTSRQVRSEATPLMHRLCGITTNVTDFNFEPLLTWLDRIPPEQLANLSKNADLRIRLCTTSAQPPKPSETLRRWLHLRADRHRLQPAWRYCGSTPPPRIATDLKRRAKRMKSEPGKRAELVAMLDAIGIDISR